MRTGVDIVSVDRIERILSNRRSSFYRKIFTGKEVDYIRGKNHNSKTISGMFASKEAVSKLIGTGIGKIGWKDIEVLHDSKGRPYINMNSKIVGLLEQIDLKHIDISISHEKRYAISFAIGFK